MYTSTLPTWTTQRVEDVCQLRIVVPFVLLVVTLVPSTLVAELGETTANSWSSPGPPYNQYCLLVENFPGEDFCGRIKKCGASKVVIGYMPFRISTTQGESTTKLRDRDRSFARRNIQFVVCGIFGLEIRVSDNVEI